MPREHKGITRPNQPKNFKRCFIIASEGADTERLYFEGLAALVVEKRLDKFVKIEFIKREKEEERTKSSHKEVMKQLDAFKKKFRLDKRDELWLVIDRDKQNNPLKNLAEISQKCSQKNYFLALSNPNFELWLLLHLKDLQEYSEQELEAFFQNKNFNSSKKMLDKELSQLLEGYDKSKYDFKRFEPSIPKAIERAKNLDTVPNERWIEENLGTRVYILVEKILCP